MEALAEAHDGSVQMIDTSIVRVHQHGGPEEAQSDPVEADSLEGPRLSGWQE